MVARKPDKRAFFNPFDCAVLGPSRGHRHRGARFKVRSTRRPFGDCDFGCNERR